LVQSGRKAVSKFELTETEFERTVSDKIARKPHLEKKMIVLSTFLESSLNFPSNNLGNTTKFDAVTEKSGVKV